MYQKSLTCVTQVVPAAGVGPAQGRLVMVMVMVKAMGELNRKEITGG